MKVLLIFGAVVAIALSGPTARAQTSEIVVTGSRIDRYAEEDVPVVHLTVRPDFLTDGLRITNDSRDPGRRRQELLRTARAVVARAARHDGIALSSILLIENDYDELVFAAPLPSDLSTLIERNARADTSDIKLLVKTALAETDTFATATERLAAFADEAEGVGRTLVTVEEEPSLSIVDLDAYRRPLIDAIAADAREIGSLLGDAGTVEIGGLQSAPRLRQSGPLDLTLYLPYSVSVTLD